MKKLILIASMLVMGSVFAVIPTTDVYQVSEDTSTTSSYVAQIPGYLAQMNNAMNTATQVQALHGLAAVQGSGNALCNLCDAKDLASVQNYVNQVNNDLCSQFSTAMNNITGSQNAITSLQQVLKTFATNPKAAGLALQQAAVATQSATQNTLAQIEVLQAQAQQKTLADEKMAHTQQATMQNSLATGGW